MCKAANKTAAALMTAIEPELKSLLTFLGIASTPEGVAAINAYDAALAAVEAWTPGTTSADVVQVVNAFTQVFNTLPIPAAVKTLADLISAAVVTVITVITANSPAPAPAVAHAGIVVEPEVAEAAQTFHAHAVAAAGEAKVTQIAGIQVSHLDKARAALGDTQVAAKRFKSEWNVRVDSLGPEYAALAAK
jgi:hypothetical protein